MKALKACQRLTAMRTALKDEINDEYALGNDGALNERWIDFKHDKLNVKDVHLQEKVMMSVLQPTVVAGTQANTKYRSRRTK